MKFKNIGLVYFVCLAGCGASDKSETPTEEAGDLTPDLTLNLSDDFYTEIDVTNTEGFHYFKNSNGRIYDLIYSVGGGDVDESNTDGFDPYDITENQMIFEHDYIEFGEPFALEGTIYNYELLIYPGGLYCVDVNTGQVPCSNYLDQKAEFSVGAVAYPYKKYYSGNMGWESYFLNEVALNDIKKSLLGSGD